MTCIVGIQVEGSVLMAADSAAVSGWEGIATTTAKVFRVGDMLIGYTTSFRMGQILQYHLSLPVDNGEDSPHAYLVRRFIPEIRSLFREHGYMERENERESGGQFLVGYRGRLYTIDSDFQVNGNRLGYASIGVGSSYAMGAMYATQKWENPGERLQAALESAEAFCIAVKRPFFTEML